MEKNIDAEIKKQAFGEYERWLRDPRTDFTLKDELYNIKGNEEEIISRFAAPLEFGTAGLRGVMGAGIARMNIHTVTQATRGVARLVLDAGRAEKGVVIAHDSRNRSRLFAETTARVLAYYNIKVYLFDSLRPTPELSFAVLYKNAAAGINITASHNPKDYNGYKVCWSDGVQLSPEHAEKAAAAAAQYDVLCGDMADPASPAYQQRVEAAGEEIDREYLKNVLNCVIDKEIVATHGDALNIIYTPLHGAAHLLVPRAFEEAGIRLFHVVPNQAKPDGDFPTLHSPNPESEACFDEGKKYAEKMRLHPEIMLATDPDGDRLGVAARTKTGEMATLSGNQIGVILLNYLIKARRAKKTLPQNAAAVRSAVSSELFDHICLKNGVTPVVVLTGFKWIGGKIHEFLETGEYAPIFGYEESLGFLPGTHARDKDAVASALVMAEAAAHYKSRGMTLFDALDEIYDEYGHYAEATLSLFIDGILPMETMKAKMARLRDGGPQAIGGVKLVEKGDYLSGIICNLVTRRTVSAKLPKSDMLSYKTADGTKIIIRPSGTEPKVKAYILASGKDAAETEAALRKYQKAVETLVDSI